MENAQLVGLSRQVTLRRHLDVIANNLANVNTNGFKAQALLFEEERMPASRVNVFNRLDRPTAFVVDDAQVTDFEPGQMVQSGNPLDVAINGKGWFVVETPQGERFTRDGALKIDATGRLVNTDGYPVLGEGGQIAFGPEETDIAIATDGTISTNQGARGRIRVVEFENENRLTKIGDNLFAGENPQAATAFRVAQGFVERSNVESVQELTRMIAVTRAYESVTNWMRQTDELRRTAIERLGKLDA